MAEYRVAGLARGSGFVIQGLGGEAVAAYELVYLSGNDLWSLADASAAATLPVVGLAVEPLTLNQFGRILVRGVVNNNAWAWTPGDVLYASDVAGQIVAVAGTVEFEVGVAITATKILFNPQITPGAGGVGRGVDDVFIPAPNPDSFIGDHSAVQMLDGIDVLVRMDFFLPLEFDIATWSVDVLVVAGGTGNLRRGVDTDFGLITELYNANSDTIAAGVVAVTINLITAIDITAALTGSTALDMVGMEFTRTGSHGDDTVGATCYFLGVLIRRP